jgi:hypothetical protein
MSRSEQRADAELVDDLTGVLTRVLSSDIDRLGCAVAVYWTGEAQAAIAAQLRALAAALPVLAAAIERHSEEAP